jgi:inosine/xanthosine triphosphate pyrophosphatase family protein
LARESFKIAGIPALVEIEVFEFEALNRLPGPYIQEFYDKIGNACLIKLLSNFENKTGTMKSFSHILGPLEQSPKFS